MVTVAEAVRRADTPTRSTMAFKDGDLVTCEDCGKEGLKGASGLRMHARWCKAAPVPEGTENASEVVAQAAVQQPAAVLGKASWRVESAPPAEMPASVRDPDGNRIFNVTHAWYFAPPVVDMDALVSTTGLPDDVFLSSPSWMSHQKQAHIDAGHMLVTPIDAYGMKKRGTPYVHILPPSREDWDEIVELWRGVIPEEIRVESEMLDQAEADLERAADAGERSRSRTTVRVLSRRVLQLESLDFDAAHRFFLRECQFSTAIGRTDVQMMDDQMDDRIAAAALEGGWND